MMEVCFDPEMTNIALIPEACKGKTKPAEFIEWDHLPLGVYMDTENPKQVKAAVQAIDVWNSWLGFETFKLVTTADAADVILLDGGPHEMYRGMTLYARTDEGKGDLFSFVLIYDAALGDAGTMTHELGHVLGLEHDPDNSRSIMYPNTARYVPWLEPQDKLLLQSLYHAVGPKKVNYEKQISVSENFQESLFLNTAIP
jgi:hypothetical protein